MDVKLSTVAELREQIEDLGARLTLPIRRYCDAWLTNGQNGTKAYLAVFNTNKPTCASAGASRLMRRPDVKAYIELMRQYHSEEILNHLAVTRQRILDEESKLAFIDVRNMFDSEGEFLPPRLWPEEVARAIAGLDVDQRWDKENEKWKYTYKIKLSDKGRALGRLETVMGMNKADGLQDDDRNLFQSFLKSVDGRTRGKLPSEFEDDKE